MPNISIKPVSGLLGTLRFIRLNQRMYKGHQYAVPDFTPDLIDTLIPSRNAASEFCEWQLFMAYKDGRAVGRVVAAINHKANETWGEKCVRFGWIEFEDDIEVSRALLETVEQWGRERGMTHIEGPLGFTDMDPEGMLIDGFDQLSTMATIYNFPYYPKHMEQLGWEKATDWVERKVVVPPLGADDPHAAKYMRVARISAERYGFRVHKFKSIKEIKDGGYQYQFFDVINKAYANLFGYSQMTCRQMDAYADQYLGYMDLRLVTFVMNSEGKIIAVGACMPSLSRALQRCDGKLFPKGWWELLKLLKLGHHDEYLDMLLVAVDPEYQNKGVNAFLFADLIPIGREMGFKWAETHPQLEDNDKSQGQWQHLDCVVHKRRRCWKKTL